MFILSAVITSNVTNLCVCFISNEQPPHPTPTKKKSAVELADLIECRSAWRAKLRILTAATNGPIRQLIIRSMCERYTAECNGIRLSSDRHLRNGRTFLGLQAQLSLLAHLITMSSVSRLNAVRRHTSRICIHSCSRMHKESCEGRVFTTGNRGDGKFTLWRRRRGIEV